jgi:hypothetical protein
MPRDCLRDLIKDQDLDYITGLIAAYPFLMRNKLENKQPPRLLMLPPHRHLFTPTSDPLDYGSPVPGQGFKGTWDRPIWTTAQIPSDLQQYGFDPFSSSRRGTYIRCSFTQLVLDRPAVGSQVHHRLDVRCCG